MPNELTIRATWGREPLPAGGEGQLAYLLIDLAADPQAMVQTTALPLNLALVLDHSGSMSGPKLQHMKEAVQRVIDQLSPNDTLSVTVFDERAKLLISTQKVTDKEALKALVAGLREAGGTKMSSGLQMGLDEVRRATGPDVVSRMLLLTDGQTWGDAEECVDLAKTAGRVGVPLSAFGVGADEDWSIGLLDRIAEASGGSADYIAQPADMLASFRKTVQTMQETVITRATLTLQLSAGVTARAVYRITPMIARVKPQLEGDRAVTLQLGDVGRDAPATVLYELTLPARRPGQYRLARAVAQYEVPGAPEAQRTADLDILATFVAGAATGPGNPRVMNIVEKATAFRLQTRALEEADVGNIPAATRNLRSAATRLLNLGETDLAQAAEQEAERLERKGQMSPGGTKKLTFATRKLALDDAAPTPAAEGGAATPPAAAGPVSAPAPAAAAQQAAGAPPFTNGPAEEVATQRVGRSVAPDAPRVGATTILQEDAPTPHIGATTILQEEVPTQRVGPATEPIAPPGTAGPAAGAAPEIPAGSPGGPGDTASAGGPMREQ